MENKDNETLIVKVDKLSVNLYQKEILSSISFKLKPRETLVFVGKNGSGKTVLLKSIVGLFHLSQGSSIILGKNIHSLKGKESINILKRIGYVFQKSGLFDSMSITDNVIFSLKRFSDLSQDELEKKATYYLNKTGLKGVENLFPSELSGGMQKRAGIARTIAMEPELLIMDDPSAGLDPVLSDSIANLILEFKEVLSSAFIIVTHDLKFAYKLADRIGLLIDGKLYGILDKIEFQKTEEATFKQFREGELEGNISFL